MEEELVTIKRWVIFIFNEKFNTSFKIFQKNKLKSLLELRDAELSLSILKEM